MQLETKYMPIDSSDGKIMYSQITYSWILMHRQGLNNSVESE